MYIQKILVLSLLIITCFAPTENIQKRTWTIIIYMAADNNLGPFARKNLKEQAKGDYPSIYRFVHLDIKIPGNKKVTKEYLLENDKLIVQNGSDLQVMDSGNPNTLIQCCKFAIEHYPSENYMLIIWDHGSGPIDFYWQPSRIIPSSDLSPINPLTNLIELNRSITFSDYIDIKSNYGRGICFDETTGHYITNQGLEYALKTICKTCLNGKKFNIIAFDACFMATLEIANIVKDYAQVMIASEEIEWATGWRYDLVFAPFAQQHLDTLIFAEHIIKVYNYTYKQITSDYTLSAVNLEKISLLEKSIDRIATLLINCLQNQQDQSVTKALQLSRNKLLCTSFYEPNYIDLFDFLTNLSTRIKSFSLRSDKIEQEILTSLTQEIKEAQQLISHIVVANAVGKNLENAKGISIYFPEQKIHPSYEKTKFCLSNTWLLFIKHYLNYL